MPLSVAVGTGTCRPPLACIGSGDEAAPTKGLDVSAYDEILGALPVDRLAQQLGSSPEDVKQAAAAVLPALLGGLDANSRQGGAASLVEALGQHDGRLLLDGGADPAAVDASDGQAIAANIFGDQQDAVAERLGASPLSGQGVSSSLVKRLIPLIAPMVLSWLAGRVLGSKGGAGTVGSASGGGLENVLQDVLGSVTGQGSSGGAPSSGGIDAGSIIGDLLGGILGGGRR